MVNQCFIVALQKRLFFVLMLATLVLTSLLLLWQMSDLRKLASPFAFRARSPLPKMAGALRTLLTTRSNASHHNSTAVSVPSSSSGSPPSSSLNATSKDSKSAVGDESPKVLCMTCKGRLGNEMFQYASTLGIALSLNRTPVIQCGRLRRLLKHYPKPKPELKERCSKAAAKGERSCCRYFGHLTQLDPKLDYRIGTYLQSYRYFEKHEAEVRKALLFSDGIRNQVSSVVRQLRQKYNSSTLIGVHIRRGDIATEHAQKRGIAVPDVAYLNRSLSFFQALYPPCVFVVASDDMQWCKDNFPPRFEVYYLDKRAPAVDMSIVAAMDHTIISFGTFSWWVGFLNTGKTVYMKNSFKMHTEIGNMFNAGGRDHVYPHWIPL